MVMMTFWLFPRYNYCSVTAKKRLVQYSINMHAHVDIMGGVVFCNQMKTTMIELQAYLKVPKQQPPPPPPLSLSTFHMCTNAYLGNWELFQVLNAPPSDVYTISEYHG